MNNNDITMAQVEAGERAVVERLRSKGLLAPDASTTPPDFHEQARQLVLGWALKVGLETAVVGNTQTDLINSVVSFATEAATAALEQAARVAEKADAWSAQRRKGERIADKIRALKPDAAIGDDKK